MSGLRRAWSDTFRSSNIKSRGGKVEKRLSDCLPAVDWPVYDENGDIKSFNGWHVFGSQTARNHFIKHVLILLSNNGKNDLDHKRFDNFFARSYDEAGVIWYTASIVVTAPGDYRIRNSIVATRAGTTKTAAFQLLILDVETKLDAILRGNGVNSGGLPTTQSKKKKSSNSVDIISRPSQAMRKPIPKPDDCNTWSGAPMTASPKSKPSTVSSHSSKDSQDTQKTLSSSKYSQDTQPSETTSYSATASPPSLKNTPTSPPAAPTESTTSLEREQYVRHASAPVQPETTSPPAFSHATKHFSQPPRPKFLAFSGTVIKALPPSPRACPEKPPISPELSKIHPAFRPKSPESSADTLLPPPQKSFASSLAGSSIYSRPQSGSPVSPLNEDDVGEEEMQALHVDSVLELHADSVAELHADSVVERKGVREDADEDVPSPLHFEKPIASRPARLLGRGLEFEIHI